MQKHLFKLFTLAILAAALFSCDPEEVSPDPVAAFEVDPNSVLQAGEEIAFINNSTDAVSYVWSFGDGNTANGETVTHVYETAGTYTVTLEATADGNRNTASMDLTIEAAPDNRALLFIDNTDLKLKQLTLADDAVTDVFDLAGFSLGLAYDATNGYVYYTDDDNLTVVRNTLAGDNEAVIASELGGPRGLALDEANQILYVVDRSNDQVVAIDLSDNSSEVIFDTTDDPNFLLPVGIAFSEGVLYMTAVDFDAETVWTGNPDGSGLTKIIDFAGGGFGYGIAVDGANGHIYFDDNDGGSVRRANLDGTGVESFASASDRVYGIAIDNSTETVHYSTRDGSITAAAMDRSGAVNLLASGNDLRGMILINLSN